MFWRKIESVDPIFAPFFLYLYKYAYRVISCGFGKIYRRKFPPVQNAALNLSVQISSVQFIRLSLCQRGDPLGGDRRKNFKISAATARLKFNKFQISRAARHFRLQRAFFFSKVQNRTCACGPANFKGAPTDLSKTDTSQLARNPN